MFIPRFTRPLAVSLLAVALPLYSQTQLTLGSLGVAAQTSGSPSANPASLAIDGDPFTFNDTPDAPGSFWEIELGRAVRVTRIEVVPQLNADNVVLRIFDLRDHTLFQAKLSGTAPGATWATNLPAAVDGRIIHLALENGETNGAGNFRVSLAEVRAFGDPSPSFGPVNVGAIGTATESSVSAAASLAIDGNPATFSETLDQTNSYWLLTLDRARPVQRVELVNRPDGNAARLQGLTLRILDDASNTVATTTVANPGAGNNWSYTAPPGTTGRYVRIGLEGGATNGQGNRIVSLAEVSVFGDTNANFGLGVVSYMTRDSDTLPPDANGNDGSYSTAIATINSTHDCYWEMNLGQPRALYSVRIVSSDGLQADMQHATLSIFDGNYNLVFAQHLAGSSEIFDVPLPGPVFGQFVHVGLDYAERSHSGSSWFIGMKEVQAFGRATNETGVLSFTATQTQIVSSASTTLQWQEADLYQLNLFPGIGSVGSNTASGGAGSRLVTPPASVEYALVGSNYSGNFTRALTIEVDGQKLPARISEFVASDVFSLKDGNGNAADWIELHNPNNTTLDLTGYYLSDDPAALTQWKFPNGVTIAPHGYLIVFADNAKTNETFDAGGYLHAGFGLDANGESLLLVASNGTTVVDAITNFPAQADDLAYGRTLNGVWTFIEPTPRAANVATTYAGWLVDPDFDHKRGWYSNAFSLAISNPNPSSVVYWSTDGTEPTNVYTGPLSITDVTGVRATVARAGYKSPRTKTHTYLFLDGIVNSTNINATYRGLTYTNRLRQGFLDLPIFSINVPPADPKWDFLLYNNERPDREASLEIFMPDGSDVQQNCSLVHYGGQFGTGTGNPYAKKSWQVQFHAQFGASKLNFPIFQGFAHGLTPRNTVNEIDIHSGNHDMSSRGFYISHRFAADTMLDMGDINPHGRFVHLFINGQYMGQFDAHERLTDSFLADYLGGAKEDYLTVKGNDNTGTFGFIPGVADPPDRSAWENVRSNKNSYVAIKDSLDLTNYIDWVLVWQWGNAESEYRGAGARAPFTGGAHGFKFWMADADKHVPRTNDVAASLTKNSTSGVFSLGPGYIFGALITEGHSDFKTLLADRIYKAFFNGGPMTPEANLARLNLRMAEITNSLVAECARWGGVTGRTPENWEGNAQGVRDNFFPFRSANLVGYMRAAGWYPSFDPPTLSQYGGSVSNGYTLTVTAPGGVVYYTLDGSDPRLPGGGISPTAIAWTNSQTISNVVSVPLSSTWRYFNTNVAPAGTWQATNFNDSAWLSGNAPMGYPAGDGGETFGVILNFGTDSNNKWNSYYFRKAFTVTNLLGITQLTVGLNRDDGAVVYLNGTELMRDNMPAGPVTFATFASSAVSGSNETNVFQFAVPAGLLVAGSNVLAVEVHQDAANSSDIHFNLSLKGSVTNSSSQLSLVLTNDTIFTARIWNGTTWSALEQTSFVIGTLRQPVPGDLVISELNYHPPDLDDYEYVEIYNAGTNLLDLTNVRLADGIDFTFPNRYRLASHAFTLAVRSTTAFNQRYQTPTSPYYYPNIAVAGQYTGKLSDSGERIALLASNGVVLAEVTYADGGDWPSRADGNGSSLELRDPVFAASVPTNLNAHLAFGPNWKSSSLYFGSPGRLDPNPARVVINEVVAHTDVGVDWVELKNLTPNPVDLSSYFLSDHFNNPFRYDFPAGTIIPGNAFLILSETNLGFGFSELGSDILVTETLGTNIVRFADTVDTPAVQREEPLGRYTRSDQATDFTELRSKTEGAENDLPRVGPVVFSEIMYKPDTNKSEFVEIVNIAHTNVLFYDPTRPTNTWHLDGAITFAFPTNQSLAPGAVAILCATNPSDFRLQYGVTSSIPVYGPWNGALNNAGENVRLELPGDPETNGFVPYYRVEHVRYEPVAPWPPAAAASNGVSLERATLEAYGNDPVSWTPSAPGGTPGAFIGNHPPDVQAAGNTTVTEGQTVALTVQGTDPDQPWQTVSVAGQNLPAGSSYDPNTGAFSWPTTEADGPGVYNLRFVATDSGINPMVRTQAFVVTVLESNQPPSLSAVGNFSWPALVPLTLDLHASDPDLPAQPLAFGASGLPVGLSINSTSGRISGAAQIEGAYPVQLSVSDNQAPPLFATNGFTLTVTHAFLTQVALAANQPQFSFWSMAGQNYDIQYTPTLSPPSWQLLQHVSNAAGGLISVSNAPAGSEGFIRVLWLR